MKTIRFISYALLSLLFFGLSMTAYAGKPVPPEPDPTSVIDPAAETVKLSLTCTENGVLLDNCFTGFGDLTDWMTNTRIPNAEYPLHVEIGPGTFVGSRHTLPDGTTVTDLDVNIFCDPANGFTGYVFFDGSGSTQTILQGTGSSGTSSVNITDCTDLSFANLKITTSFYGGIYWNGGGNSRWTNVDVDTVSRVWAEPTCGAEQGKHYWYSSKINANAAFTIAETYRASCDETWFFGSEVKATIPQGQSINATPGVVSASNNGIIHLYGSNLRSISNGVNTPPAASVDQGGEIHIHGTGIDVISNTGSDIVALRAANGGLIHADVSAYVMKTTGTKTRIDNSGGTVNASYQWAQSNQPPQIVSENGADMTVETNCDGTGCHDSDTGIETHLLIYNDNCNVAGHGPWFDVVTGKCRGDLSVN
jgi:hypothetical protein